MPDKPRLAIISRLYPRPGKPGSGAFNRHQFQRLAARYDVSLLVPVPLHERVLRRGQLAPARDGEIDVRYRGWAFPPRVGRVLYPACFALSLLPERAWLRRLDPACLLVSWAYPDAVGVAALIRTLALPLVIKVHGSDLNVHAAGRLRIAQLCWAASRACAVVFVSEALRQRAVALGVPEDKTIVVRNGVDGERFRPAPRASARAETGQAPERRSILFAGNVLRAKGVRELMGAFERLAAGRAELDLVVVGEGDEAGWLRERAAAIGLEQRVRLVGHVPHDRLAPWFNAADVVCLPSHSEGLPNVLLEAMACGVPSVATRVGGIPEAVTPHTGELVEVFDVDGLAAALRRTLDRSWDREAMLREAARFSWDANVDAMSDVIERARRRR
jgi:glycosyltransferase involved in cell wall biosynthesis